MRSKCRKCGQFVDLDMHTCVVKWIVWVPEWDEGAGTEILMISPMTAARRHVQNRVETRGMVGSPVIVHVRREDRVNARQYQVVVRAETFYDASFLREETDDEPS